MAEKPILFSTPMVRAILDGRKTVTRRVCRITVNGTEPVDHGKCVIVAYPERNFKGICANFSDNSGFYVGAAYPPYLPGDILWVRETWASLVGSYLYRADQKPGMKNPGKWCPSIHMPREAARIFLRVTDVRVERLMDISLEDAAKEGCENLLRFDELWDSTYGWEANPWVWVIEFERTERPVSGE